jgi:HD domain
MSVCALVLEAGGDEDQAIAALLHDAVEDQGGRPTLDTIRHMFGDRVAAVVLSCSDSTATNPDEKLDWHERKDEYIWSTCVPRVKMRCLFRLPTSSTMAERFCPTTARGDKLWARFKASKEDQLKYYGALLDVLEGTAAPKRLVEELRRVVDELKQLAESN